jgi:hypothetical protein
MKLNMLDRLEIKIGDTTSFGNTAVVVRRPWDFISHNDGSYWVYLEDFGIDAKVDKKPPKEKSFPIF